MATEGNFTSLPSSSEAIHLTDDGADYGHKHLSQRSPWLRAALLGANDGLVSCASLMVGVGAVKTDHLSMIVSGLSGLVAGACSMAIGEYVSVYGQRDAEEADLRKEIEEHAKGPIAKARELEELAQIYVERGLSASLARQVAEELSAADPIKAHARDEIGIDVDNLSNPLQAALVSAAAFSMGGTIPLLSALFIDDYNKRFMGIVGASSLGFVAFSALGAFLGGAAIWKASLRGTIGGWMAMLITFGTLTLFGSAGL